MGEGLFTFHEYFAGGGMARAGLGPGWTCLFANDADPAKGRAYAAAWGDPGLRIADVAALTGRDLPGDPDLAWASFPCQDLSLAGEGRGMRDGARRTRSGAFWPFWDLVRQSPPPLVVLENVVGVLTSRGGTDFAAILGALADGGYRFGALVLDAVHFLPQSRPRVFIIALRADVAAPSQAMGADAPQGWTWPSLIGAHARLPVSLARRWVWWRLPPAPGPRARLADIVEAGPPDVVWRSRAETESLIALMSPVNRAKLKEAMDAGGRQVGTLFRRTRGGQVRAEVRFDGAAGCLRTPGGGSSRQTLLVVEDGAVRSRLLSAREAARLMGLPDSHPLPTRYSAAMHLLGDGVAVPVVRHLAAHLLEPLARAARQDRHEALRQAS